MKAMILSAGLGTRLRPLTERWPKPAIPLLGKPLFRYALAPLRRAGVTALGINTHHLGETMAEVARAECQRVQLPLTVVHEPIIQGTGGGIRGLRSLLQDDDFIVFNGDVLFAVDLKPVVAAHQASGAAATMVLLPMPKNEKFSAVERDPSGAVRRIGGKGPGGDRLSPWHFTGVHVMTPAVFDFMAPEGVDDIIRVYLAMIEKGLTVRGHVVDAYWSDLGTPSRYLATQRDLLFGQVPTDVFPDASPFEGATRASGNWWAEEGVVQQGGIAGPAYLARGAQIARGAQLGSAVFVGDGAKVGEGARLNRATVMEGTEIAPGEELVETIAWGKHRIPAPLTDVSPATR